MWQSNRTPNARPRARTRSHTRTRTPGSALSGRSEYFHVPLSEYFTCAFVRIFHACLFPIFLARQATLAWSPSRWSVLGLVEKTAVRFNDAFAFPVCPKQIENGVEWVGKSDISFPNWRHLNNCVHRIILIILMSSPRGTAADHWLWRTTRQVNTSWSESSVGVLDVLRSGSIDDSADVDKQVVVNMNRLWWITGWSVWCLCGSGKAPKVDRCKNWREWGRKLLWRDHHQHHQH